MHVDIAREFEEQPEDVYNLCLGGNLSEHVNELLSFSNYPRRVFVNTKSMTMYFELFWSLFTLLERLRGKAGQSERPIVAAVVYILGPSNRSGPH
jgi:hypothetical protein